MSSRESSLAFTKALLTAARIVQMAGFVKRFAVGAARPVLRHPLPQNPSWSRIAAVGFVRPGHETRVG
jgi:hypothetical protein